MIDGTPFLRLWARRRRQQLAAMSPVETQRNQLLKLVHAARRTVFGKTHRFDIIRSVGDFQSAVPIRDYDAYQDDIWKDRFPDLTDTGWPGPVVWYAVTSGTTRDVTKYIPVTQAMIQSNKQAVLDMYAHHLAAKPDSRVFGGLNFMLGGSTDLTTLAPGIRAGDLSGIAAATMPAWVRPRIYPPQELALEADWERKINLMARGSVNKDIRSIAGTPSWLLLLFDKLADFRPEVDRDVTRIWPNLDLVVHGGVRFDPYKPQFDTWVRGRDVDYREAYAASEGFIASSDRGFGQGMRLNLDTGLFFEFIPLDDLGSATPTRHWIGNVEPGIDYAIVLSTCAGLWGWLIGDTVRIVERDPPRLLVSGRTSYMMSAFGEHLIGDEIDRAVIHAAETAGLRVTDYAMGAVFPTADRPLGGHRYLIEFASGIPAETVVEAIGRAIDGNLAEGNADYAAHRSGGYGMLAPVVFAKPPGFFAAWMKSRGKLGGQNKVPRVINDTVVFDELAAFAFGEPECRSVAGEDDTKGPG